MINRITTLESATGVAAAAQTAIGLFVWRFGSQAPIPMHFNAAGEVDRWGDRAEAAGVILGIAAVTLLAGAALAFAARRPEAEGSRRRTLGWGQFILIATTTVVSAMIGLLASGTIEPATEGPRVVSMAVCAIFAIIGAVVGKVPPNALVGVRTPWSLTSRLAWEKSNRLAGRLFFWVGVAGLLLTPLLPNAMATGAVVVAALAIAGISVFESWRVWRADPERRLV